MAGPELGGGRRADVAKGGFLACGGTNKESIVGRMICLIKLIVTIAGAGARPQPSR
jgi:hypothetical protein